MSNGTINKGTIVKSGNGGGGGGSSKEIKILNVIQTGTLTRDGAMFSGFSTSNYLQLGARVDKGILSLDSSTYTKDFGLVASQADSWEIVFKIKNVVYSGDNQALFTLNTNTGNQFMLSANGAGAFMLLSGTGSSWDINFSANYTMVDNQDYYIKFFFDGENYGIGFSTDGTNYTQETTPSSWKMTSRNAQYKIGSLQSLSAVNFRGKVYLEESYIKINGEFWWKGVETI